MQITDTIRRSGVALLGVFFILLTVPAAAQKPPAESQTVLPAGIPDRDREIFNLVNDIMKVRLQRELELNGQGFDTLMDHLGTTKDDMVRLKWERGYAREALRECIDTDVADAEVGNKLGRILDLELETVETLRAMIEASKPCISVPLSAKLYLFVDDFEAYLRRLVYSMGREHGVHQREIHERLSPTEAGEEPASDDPGRIPRQQEFVQSVREDNPDVRLQDYTSDDLIAIVDALLMVRLAEAVGLSSNESLQLFQRVGSHKDQLHQLKWIIGEQRGNLRHAVNAGAPHPEIAAALDDLLLQEKAVADIVRTFITEARNDLTVRQCAKLYLFLGDFEEYVVDLLEQTSFRPQ